MGPDFDLESIDRILSQRESATDSEGILPIHGVNFQIDHRGFQEEASELDDDVFVDPPSRPGYLFSLHKNIADLVYGIFQSFYRVNAETRVVGKFKPKAKTKMNKEGSIVFDFMRPTEVDAIGDPSLSVPPDSSTIIDNQEKNAPEAVMVDKQKTTVIDEIDGHLQEDLDGEGSEADLFDDADIEQTYKELRKETSDDIRVNDDGKWRIDDEMPNDSEAVGEVGDEDYTTGRPFKKKTPGKPKRVSPQVDRNAPSVSKSPTQDTQKRKFCHFTKRKRRVDKVLLETPEEDINPMKLKIKDLILIAEAREHKATKEAGETGRSHRDQSSGENEGDHPVKIRLNYHTYMNKPRSERWSKMDTDLFYQAVRQFGTDFAMIQQLFPNRTRHQIKLKFKNEERKHPLQIADAVVHRSKDHSQFELVIDRLRALEEEAGNSAEAPADPAESQATAAETEEGDDGMAGEKKEEFQVDDWDQQEEEHEEQDVFDWTQYDSNYGTDKSAYDDMF